MSFVDDYLTRVEARQAESTLKGKTHDLREFASFLDERGLAVGEGEVSPIHVEDYIDWLLNQSYAERTVQSRIYSVSSLYEYLVNRDVVDSNPTDSVELGFLDSARMNAESKVRHIEKDDYLKMVEGDIPIRDEVCIRLLWNCGLRRSEAVAVELSDINREERSIVVQDAKSPSKSRTVFYSRRFERALREYIDRGGRSAHLGSADSSYLLVSRREEQMSPQRVGIIVRERAKDVGIQQVVYVDQDGRERSAVTAHALRFSYSVHRVRNGMDISQLSDLLGHESIDTTKIYLSYDDSDLKQADEKYRP